MRTLFLSLLAAFALASPVLANAQAYPSKTIKIIVPFAVGGIADTFGRVIAQKLTETWGQPVVVENKGLVIGNIGTHAVNPYLMKNMPFDPLKDFVPIAHVLDAEGLLVVYPALPVKSVAELIAYGKANPGKLAYASGGMGTTSHLAGELFKSMSGIDMVHVPYKGNSPAITDVMGGQAQMIFATMPTVIQQAKSGRLRMVATLGATRAKATPDIPTIAETLPGFDVANWIGMFAPAGTPQEIVVKLNAEVQKIMRSPDVETRLEAEGAKFIPTTPESFAAFQRAEAAKWAAAIKAAGIKQE